MDQTVIALLFVPAKTPHTSTEITADQIVYLVVRVENRTTTPGRPAGAPSGSPVPTIIGQGLAFMPTGEAREQHRHDASEENTIKSPGATDRGDRRAELADGIEV
jgi:hypothetical protein